MYLAASPALNDCRDPRGATRHSIHRVPSVLRALALAAWACLGLLAGQRAQAQGSPGGNDPSFNVFDDGTYADGANNNVYSCALQPDGKVLIGGLFGSYNGTTRNHIARLDSDGSLDTSFNPGTGANGTVFALALQPDGKVLIGGAFTSYNGTTRNRIARLNSDGSLDTSFNPGSGTNNTVYALAMQPDGKVLIGGFFGSYNGTPRGSIARLNSDGSLDTSFNPGTGANSTVAAIALQPDGKVLICGAFSSYNSTTRNRIARLNSDASLDTSFNPGTGASDTVSALALQPDGKVLIGGYFTTYNGVTRNCIARLNSNASLDTSFNPVGGANSNVMALALQPDGKVLVGGNFTTFNGVGRQRLARLQINGALDTSFIPGLGAASNAGFINEVSAIVLQPDDKVLVGGEFNAYNNVTVGALTRLNLNLDASRDASFNPGGGADSSVGEFALLPDGKALVGGGFTRFNGIARGGIARLNADGSLDGGFASGAGFHGSSAVFTVLTAEVLDIVLQPDGKVLVGGRFENYDGFSCNTVARLNADGSFDTSFGASTALQSFRSAVHALALQPDGKVLIGGDFTIVNSTTRNLIARLNTDGSLDTSFDPGIGPAGGAGGLLTTVHSIALQPDGKVYIGGNFTSFNGIARNGIARLNANGSLDTSFNPGTGLSGGLDNFTTAFDLALRSDGKLLVGGDFSAYNGVARKNLVRVNADGSLDGTFNSGTGANNDVNDIELQPDGRLLVGGSFSTFNGVARAGVVLLNADGSLDGTFDTGTDANKIVRSCALQPDGKVLIGGAFTSYGGAPRHRIARLYAAGTPEAAGYCFGDGLGTACPCGNAGLAGRGCANSVNPDGARLRGIGASSLAADSLSLQGSGMPNSSALYFQGTAQLTIAFGDGLRCVAGTVVRIGTKANASGASSYPGAGDLLVSVRGGVAQPGVRNYQVWYRNAAAFCTPSTFNLTNGVSVTWTP